jgi:hypothetical protein
MWPVEFPDQDVELCSLLFVFALKGFVRLVKVQSGLVVSVVEMQVVLAGKHPNLVEFEC